MNAWRTGGNLTCFASYYAVSGGRLYLDLARRRRLQQRRACDIGRFRYVQSGHINDIAASYLCCQQMYHNYSCVLRPNSHQWRKHPIDTCNLLCKCTRISSKCTCTRTVHKCGHHCARIVMSTKRRTLLAMLKMQWSIEYRVPSSTPRILDIMAISGHHTRHFRVQKSGKKSGILPK